MRPEFLKPSLPRVPVLQMSKLRFGELKAPDTDTHKLGLQTLCFLGAVELGEHLETLVPCPGGKALGPPPLGTPGACALTEAGGGPGGSQPPGRCPERGEAAQAEVGDAEPYDGRLVQLARDGSGQREQLGQLEELQVLFSAPRARRVPGLLLALRQ